MNQTDTYQETNDEKVSLTFQKVGNFIPVFLLISGLGILVIYFLNAAGVLGDRARPLLWIGESIVLVAGLQQVVLIFLARRNHGVAAYFVSTILITVLAGILVGLWQNSIYFALPTILLLPISGFMAGSLRKYIPWLILLVAGCIAGVFLVGNTVSNLSNFEQIPWDSPASISSVAFLAATGLLLITITAISQNRRSRSLQALLLTSFILLVTIPTVMATVLSGVGAYSNSQIQTFNTLKAISNLKENQIALLVDEIRNDAEKIQKDTRFKKNILPVLTTDNISAEQLNLNRALARSFIISIQKDKGTYTEIMILDTKGTVVLSTDSNRADTVYDDQLFFRQGTLKFFTGFTDLPEFGKQNFIVATPLYDTNDQIIRGVIVLRSDGNSIKKIMESTPGYGEAETYLVDHNFNPVTQTRVETKSVRTKAALDAIIDNLDGQATYENYSGQDVLGYYKWYEPMQMAIIAELPVQAVVRTSLVSLFGSSVLALFVIAIAIFAVYIAARSIANPISELAKVTESFTAGKFHARAQVDRKDEIGALASSYNQMAAELQDIIGKLEQRVADRTKELENQSLRVRVAAEIARDAASTRDLGDLMESSARLLLERFNFYHTGIFLIDRSREFAVLTSSPTDAGKLMIANNYKVRMGEAGVVGRVASAGEPRISLDTGSDAFHSSNPLLPETRSEMALPLKVGNLVIGVLDVHSSQPKAFTQDDITILQVMADQLATAIERTRLLQEVEYNLKELEKAYGQYTREGWQRIATSGKLINRGYRFDNIRIEPISQSPVNLAETGSSRTEESSNGNRSKNTVSIPIKLRGQTIGVISAKLREGYNPRTIATLEAATERLAAALESARLYEEARSRADREQAIAQVTTKISASTEFETILRATVEEIGKSLGNSEVSIQIINNMDDQDSI